MTAQFLSALEFEDDDGLPYVLTSPLRYYSALMEAVVIVPSGFKTDLASIPQALQNLLPRSGKYDRAAVIHDALYAWGALAPHFGRPVTRAQADAVLNEAMGVLGVNRVQRWVIYAGVRVGGGGPWDAYRHGATPQGVA